MLDRWIIRFLFLLDDGYDDFGKGIAIRGNLGKLDTAVDDLGQETYGLFFKFSLFACVISFVGIVIARLIFRIASPREDARAKSMIQTTLVITFIISMITTLFQVVVNIANGMN